MSLRPCFQILFSGFLSARRDPFVTRSTRMECGRPLVCVLFVSRMAFMADGDERTMMVRVKILREKISPYWRAHCVNLS